MKWVVGILILLLLGTNVTWAYFALDLAVTEKYRQLEESRRANYVKGLERICTKYIAGLEVESAINLLKELNPREEPWVKEGTLNSGSYSLHLNSESSHLSEMPCKDALYQPKT